MTATDLNNLSQLLYLPVSHGTSAFGYILLSSVSVLAVATPTTLDNCCADPQVPWPLLIISARDARPRP
jgi:hypothetical protein